MMADEDESRKGQNLEMIVSKLAKEKPANGNIILISGVNIQNLTFPDDAEVESDECDPDLHQCGKCKQMFSNLEKYLQHRTSKSCRKKQTDSQDVTSDDGGSPSQVPEVVQMEAPGSSNMQENESPEQLELANKRKHDRKGVARKRTNLVPEPMTSTITSKHHSNRITMDGLPEIIRPGFTSTPTFTTIGGYRTVYEHAPVPNNNDLYALMQLTKNSGIKEVHVDENGVTTSRPRELLNGGVHPIFHRSPLNSPPNHRFPAPLALHNHIPALPPNQEAVHHPENILHSENVLHAESVLVSFPGVENSDANQKGAKRRYKCDKCDRDFNQRANLRRHQLVHSGEKPFECEQCHRRFQQQGDLKRHMLRHAETTWYHCQPCDKRFMRLDRWKAHMKTHEENGTLPPEVGSSMVEMSNGPTVGTGEGEPTEKPMGSHHICSKCNQTFMEPDELLVHTCADGNIRVIAVPMETTQDGVDLEHERAVKMAERYVRTQAADSDHSRAYSSSRSTRGKLTNPHKCPLCNAHYKNEDSLKTHILKHSGEKKYKCDQCPKAFFTSSNLKIHRRIHSGDKPLKCKVCFKAFSDPSNFNKHKKSHVKGKLEPRGTPKKGRKREVKEEHPGFNETLVEAVGKEGEVMQFGSPSREFLQSQYEALLPALEDGRHEGKVDGGDMQPNEGSSDTNHDSTFTVHVHELISEG